MQAVELFVRFYKSFNFDYIRKSNPASSAMHWEVFEESWFPHIRVSLDKQITTVVGANESGKSQLLDAVEFALLAKKRERKHFCRYSQFFSVAKGKLYKPEFGMRFDCEDDGEVEKVEAVLDVKLKNRGFTLLSQQKDRMIVVLDTSDKEDVGIPLKSPQVKSLKTIIPRPKRLHATLELPDVVPIRYLAGTSAVQSTAILDRESESLLLEEAENLLSLKSIVSTKEAVTTNASAISSKLQFINHLQNSGPADEAKAALASSLLLSVAGIASEAFGELHESLAAGDEGVSNGLIETMNQHLASSLDLERWWSQDRDFAIRLTAREHDLVFTIRDRTGTDYSFKERSGGLKHFLGFFTQFQAYTDDALAGEVLLMDEPDAFLSSVAQRDLLRLFQNHVDGGARPGCRQLIYVTHSPFLIDRNHSERIRVVDKGSETEGTRVVKNAARNHYEPLRSAIGPFLAETAYAGNCNIFVEGITDQILIAGFTRLLDLLNFSEDRFLNLNDITIVPCGSANHVAYMVYLARGRDVVQPSAVVLLDADQAGKDARKQLKRKIAGSKIISDDFVLDVGMVPRQKALDASEAYIDLEDLINDDLLVQVVVASAKEIAAIEIEGTPLLKLLRDRSASGGRVDLINSHLESLGISYEASKLTIARLVVDFCRKFVERTVGGKVALDTGREEDSSLVGDEPLFHGHDGSPEAETIASFSHLIKLLELKRRAAVRSGTIDKTISQIKRFTESLKRDAPTGLTKAKILIYLEDVESVLDQSLMCRQIQLKVDAMRNKLELEDSQKPLQASLEDVLDTASALTIRITDSEIDADAILSAPAE